MAKNSAGVTASDQRKTSSPRPRKKARAATPAAVERAVYTVDEAAVITGMSRQSCYAAIRRGELPVVRLGRRVAIPKSILNDMVRLVS